MTQEPRKDNLPEWWVTELNKSKQQAEIEALKAKTLTDEEIEIIYEEFFGFKPNNK